MVRLNFVCSVWILIGKCVLEAIQTLASLSDLNQTWGPFAVRYGAWPFVIGIMETTLWITLYRDRSMRQGARVMAGLLGVWLLLQPGLTTLLIVDMYDLSTNWLDWWIYLYIAISHVAFAAVGYPRRT